MVFRVKLPFFTEKLTAMDDVVEYAFFPKKELPKSIAFEGQRKFLQGYISL